MEWLLREGGTPAGAGLSTQVETTGAGTGIQGVRCGQNEATDLLEGALVWGRLTEPGDTAASVLIEATSYDRALELVRAGLSGQDALAVTGQGSVAQWDKAIRRWTTRLDGQDPAAWARRDLRAGKVLGAQFIYRGHPLYPPAMADLGHAAPLGLWVRGKVELLSAPASIALVGTRAATTYGERVATRLAEELCNSRPDLVVVSGGAYGIDACAHTGALAVGGNTVAFLAGGPDRLYPAGNTALLERIVRHGAVVSELPPGSVPSRVRFLQRNRLIACAGATVVVEAAARSGAANTASHAVEMGRSVGAVPGNVTSQLSSGCHRLIRSGATLVTSAAEILELLPQSGWQLEEEPGSPDDQLLDGLDASGRAVLDALPTRASSALEKIAKRAGLGPQEVETTLALLEMLGKVRRADGYPPRWARA